MGVGLFSFLVTYKTTAKRGCWDLLSTSPLCFAKSKIIGVETCGFLRFCYPLVFGFSKNIFAALLDSFEENFSFSAEVVYTYDESQENGKRKRKYKLNGRNSENFNLNKVVLYKLKVRHYVNHSTSLFPFSILPKISSKEKNLTFEGGTLLRRYTLTLRRIKYHLTKSYALWRDFNKFVLGYKFYCLFKRELDRRYKRELLICAA